jgi:hypothetical protein
VNQKQQKHLSEICRCGKVKLEAVGRPILTASCYCASCQEAGSRFEQLFVGPVYEVILALVRNVRNGSFATDPFSASADQCLLCAESDHHPSRDRLTLPLDLALTAESVSAFPQ